MAWQRFGDTWADDPRLLAVMALPGADDRTLNEVRGFIATLSGESAKYTTDYVLNWGQVVKAAGSVGRAGVLTDMCVEVKLLERVDVGGLPGVKLVEDPDFIHLIKKAEADWNRQRKRDNADPNLKWPVILRDGDHCRWCHHEVHWTGKVSNRKATLDHLNPGEPGTVDTMVVACMACNSARRDDEDGSWAAAHPLLPVPDEPYWGTWSRQQLTKRQLLPSESKVDASDPSRVEVVPALGTPPVSSQPAAARPLGLQGGDPGADDHGVPAGPSSKEPRSPRGWGRRTAFGHGSPPRVRPESASSPELVRDSMPPESELPGTGRAEPGRGRERTGTGTASGRVRDGTGGACQPSRTPSSRRRGKSKGRRRR